MKETPVRAESLGDSARRVAGDLQHLADRLDGMGAVAGVEDAPSAPGSEQDLMLRAIQIRRLRTARTKYLRPELFGEPAWDILIDLYIEQLQGRQVTVSSACIAAMVPATTALRYLQTLFEGGEIVRRADPHDHRRVFVELTPAGRLAIRQALAVG